MPVYIKFFMYEVTNAEDVESSNGTVKPSLKERGPYYYIEDRIKVNMSTEDEDENRIR